MRHFSAIIFILLLVVVTPSCKYFNRGKKEKAAAALRAHQDSVRVADSLKKVQDRLMAEELARIDSVNQAEAERLAQQSKYNIVVGSFITPEYARNFSEEYKAQGYQPKIIKMDGSRFELVVAESHKNFRNALSRLKQFQDTTTIDAWMYIRK